MERVKLLIKGKSLKEFLKTESGGEVLSEYTQKTIDKILDRKMGFGVVVQLAHKFGIQKGEDYVSRVIDEFQKFYFKTKKNRNTENLSFSSGYFPNLEKKILRIAKIIRAKELEK